MAKAGTLYSKHGDTALNIFERFRMDLSEKHKELEEVKMGDNPQQKLDNLEQRKILLIGELDQYEAEQKATENERQRLELMKRPLMNEIKVEKDKQVNLDQAMLKVKLEHYFYGEMIVERENRKFIEIQDKSKADEQAVVDKLKLIDQEILLCEAKIKEFADKKQNINNQIVEVELDIVKEKKRLKEEQEKIKRIQEQERERLHKIKEEKKNNRISF